MTEVNRFEDGTKVLFTFHLIFTVQVFSVRSGGATGILCRGFEDAKCSTFRLEDQGSIVTIKLAPDQSVLAVQRSGSNSVQFVNVEKTGSNGILEESKQYVQMCKSKTANFLGFSWTSSFEIVFITDQGYRVKLLYNACT